MILASHSPFQKRVERKCCKTAVEKSHLNTDQAYTEIEFLLHIFLKKKSS